MYFFCEIRNKYKNVDIHQFLFYIYFYFASFQPDHKDWLLFVDEYSRKNVDIMKQLFIKVKEPKKVVKVKQI